MSVTVTITWQAVDWILTALLFLGLIMAVAGANTTATTVILLIALIGIIGRRIAEIRSQR